MTPRDVSTLPPVEPERRVAYGADPNQFFDVWTSEEARANIIFIHGGFWRAKYDLTHASHLCAALARDGFNVANLEYRRVGNPGGGWNAVTEDIPLGYFAAIGEVRAPKTIICGHSAGGHLALWMGGLDVGASGIVALAPVAVLRTAYELHLSNDAVVEFMGGTPQQHPEEYDLLCPSLHTMTTAVTISHGTADDVVPIRLSREFVEARKSDNVRLVELAGAGHMELIDPDDPAFDAVRAEIDRLL